MHIKKFFWYCWEFQVYYMGTQNQTNNFDRTETLKGSMDTKLCVRKEEQGKSQPKISSLEHVALQIHWAA